MLEGVHLHLLQSKIILDLEIMKKNIPKSKFYSNRLCYCKRVMFEHYVNAYQIVLIRLCSKIYRYYEDIYFNKKKKDELKSYLSSTDLRNIFKYYSLDILLKEKFISKKMVSHFHYTQEKTTAKFFDYLNDIYLDLVESIDNDDLFLATYNIIISYLKNHIEMFTFNLIGFNVSCEHIKPEIVKKFINEEDNEPFCLHKCYECRHSTDCWKNFVKQKLHNIDENTGCIVHDNITKHGEFIHLIFFEDYILSECIHFSNYLERVEEGHMNIGNIDLILDFKLVNEKDIYDELIENVDACFNKIMNKFKSIYVYQDDNHVYPFIKNIPNVYSHEEFIKTDIYKNFFDYKCCEGSNQNHQEEVKSTT